MKRCTTCDKPLANNFSLDRHIMAVHGEKVHCIFCGKPCSARVDCVTAHLKRCRVLRRMCNRASEARRECARASQYW